jgi:hypothetical protein
VRILLDECVNAGVRAALPGHEVRTVSQMGWRGLKDETLLANGQRQFDVFVTIDRKLEREHDLSQFKMGFIVVQAPSNEINSYQPMFSELMAATERVKAGEVVHLAHPHMRRR